MFEKICIKWNFRNALASQKSISRLWLYICMCHWCMLIQHHNLDIAFLQDSYVTTNVFWEMSKWIMLKPWLIILLLDILHDVRSNHNLTLIWPQICYANMSLHKQISFYCWIFMVFMRSYRIANFNVKYICLYSSEQLLTGIKKRPCMA